MRTINGILVTLLIVLCSFQAVHAAAVQRKALVFYNGAEQRTEELNIFTAGLAMPLNYQGFLYEIRDISKGPLPGKAEMDEFSAILTAFSGNEMNNPDEYLSWLDSQQRAGKKVVIVGSLGAYTDLEYNPADPKLIRKIYSNLGFSYYGNATNEKFRLKYDEINSRNMNFERKLPIFPDQYIYIVPADKNAHSWVSVSLKDRADSSGTVVGVGPGGGFALDGFMYWEDPLTFSRQWYLNPFEFLRQSLGLQGVPVLTPTTLNGKRVAFAHIDGDGFVGYSEIDENQNCGEIIIHRILAKYDFPNTVSVIAGEINPDVKGSVAAIDLARYLFEMKNVEPASHSYTHPFSWDEKFRNSPEYEDTFIVGQYEKEGYKFDARYEIVDSCEYITENLTPPEKPCSIILWSGMCDPTKEQVEIADKAGILNMNGGDTVYDAVRNSYFRVSPLYRALGKYSQIYTGQANENILTNLWEGPYFGFRNIVETMKRTGSPRRIMPIDIYYHFYSGEKFASLKALEDVYDWALKQDTARVYASSYIKMVNGYLSGRLEVLGADRFAFSDYNDCISVRLDGMDKVPDLSSSRNVIGYDIQPEGIFVHLRPGSQRAEIVLTKDKSINYGRAYIKSASGWVDEFQRTERGARLIFKCFSKGKFAVGGLVPEREYRIISQDAPPVVVRSSGDGVISVDGITSGPVEIRLI